MVRKPVATAETVRSKIILLAPELSRFEELGPFEIEEQVEREVTLSLSRTIVVDHFFAVTEDRLPIVVISHGNFSGKSAHRDQARRLASWGFHVVTLEVPNRDHWLENGKVLRQFTELLRSVPFMLGKNSDSSRIVMVGHSFGGSAATLAMGAGAPVIGAVMLDPAVVHASVVTAMQKTDLPMVLLGSDPKIFSARGRNKFSKNLRGELLEVSVPSSTHDDAQGPSMFSRSVLGFDPYTSNNRQKFFGSLLAVSVIGLTTSGTLDFARQIFFRESQRGTIKGVAYRVTPNASANMLSK